MHRQPCPSSAPTCGRPYELSWLTPRGKPQVAIAHITVPCETPNIVESKSFKLYLNSFSNTRVRIGATRCATASAPT